MATRNLSSAVRVTRSYAALGHSNFMASVTVLTSPWLRCHGSMLHRLKVCLIDLRLDN